MHEQECSYVYEDNLLWSSITVLMKYQSNKNTALLPSREVQRTI